MLFVQWTTFCLYCKLHSLVTPPVFQLDFEIFRTIADCLNQNRLLFGETFSVFINCIYFDMRWNECLLLIAGNGFLFFLFFFNSQYFLLKSIHVFVKKKPSNTGMIFFIIRNRHSFHRMSKYIQLMKTLNVSPKSNLFWFRQSLMTIPIGQWSS
jgi:hypothetical protein